MIEFVAFWILMAGTCAVVAGSKGRSVIGWLLLGALFSAVALIVVAVMPSLKPAVDAPSVETHKKCPFCAEQVRREAIVCKHCGRDLGPHDEALRLTGSPEGVALVAAAEAGNWGSVFSLLNGGADPNALDSQGRTALDVAESRKDEQIANLLRSKGAERLPHD
ncbi:zinc ribbon domain-containing protein [Aromatoleum anaerobium]|nr:hypothetical protein [Aromatoleum anaerobium]MCK0508421.1 hypothetical protein [Aromatoleum anaerobium]